MERRNEVLGGDARRVGAALRMMRGPERSATSSTVLPCSGPFRRMILTVVVLSLIWRGESGDTTQ
jgi:hypothetical protein